MKILGVMGATAVGKSQIAVMVASRLSGKIISADSMQIYKELDVGTAKISTEEKNSIEHFMLDIVSPNQSFSSFQYEEKASKIVDELLLDNILPIVVGGTGFYFDSLLYPVAFLEDDKTQLRQQLNEELKQNGSTYMYDKLLSLDKISAEQIHPNNTVRVLRALEIFYSTGRKKSEFDLPKVAKYSNVLIVLNAPRDILYQRINQRVDKMIQNGLVEEVELLLKKYSRNCQCFAAIGYKEVLPYLDKEYDLNTAIEKIKQNSRNYAKRQISYFKRFKDAIWIDVDLLEPSNTAKQIVEIYRNSQ